jgi:predicted HTH transcriptional regulator
VPSLPRLTIPDLVADPDLIKRLVYEGETLYVERKERDPKDGLGATIASFANMLGGWLLIGVTNDRKIVGYEPPGTVDLQDYVRDVLRSQVDPIPPFAAEMLPADGHMIGVVRVPESSDQPHVTREGVVYQRTQGGKEPVKEARDIIALARRGSRRAKTPPADVICR